MRLIVITLLLINLAIPAYFYSKPYWADVSTSDVEQQEERSLVLSSELPKSMWVQSETEVAPQFAEESLEENSVCYVLGVYGREVGARLAEGRAQELGIPSVLFEDEVYKSSMYRVLVPPMKSKEDALAALRRLQGQSIDSFMTQSEGQEYSISLGLFRSKESAISIRNQSRALGVEATVVENKKFDSQFWLQVNQVYKLTEDMRERIQADYQGVSWQVSECRDLPVENE